MQSDKMKRQSALDVVKCWAAFAVVSIHTGLPDKTTHEFAISLARLAVPLFLLITGYYYPVLSAKGRVLAHWIKVVAMTLAGSVGYFLVAHFNFFTDGKLEKHLERLFTADHLQRWLLWNDTWMFGVGILWYLYAASYVLLILMIADRIRIRRFMYWAIIPLLAMNYYMSWWDETIHYRNFIFMGLPYVLLGCWLREKKVEEWVKDNISGGWLAYLAFVFLMFQALEVGIYHSMGERTIREHYIFTLPLVLIVFLAALRYPYFGYGSLAARVGRKYSAYIYLVHMIPISHWKIGLDKPCGGWLFAPLVFLLSAIAVAFVVESVTWISHIIKGKPEDRGTIPVHNSGPEGLPENCNDIPKHDIMLQANDENNKPFEKEL